MRCLPMFPLGTVLLPHMVLPLHIFEPRYRTMFRDLREGDHEFGVVQIQRGHEVGGGEVRGDIGTVARIVQTEELPDGRWLAVTVGTRRFRVMRWFPDDPYPQAEVEELPDEPISTGVAASRDALVPRVRRLLALRSELGSDSAPSTFGLADDPSMACWQLLVLTPLSDLDAERLLGIDGWEPRLAAFSAMLDDLEETAGLELHGRR
jgi:Lon protease-like protein